jgi:hypothetical protein
VNPLFGDQISRQTGQAQHQSEHVHRANRKLQRSDCLERGYDTASSARVQKFSGDYEISRSAPVPGRRNVRWSGGAGTFPSLVTSRVPAPEDGRTPGIPAVSFQ